MSLRVRGRGFKIGAPGGRMSLSFAGWNSIPGARGGACPHAPVAFRARFGVPSRKELTRRHGAHEGQNGRKLDFLCTASEREWIQSSAAGTNRRKWLAYCCRIMFLC